MFSNVFSKVSAFRGGPMIEFSGIYNTFNESKRFSHLSQRRFLYLQCSIVVLLELLKMISSSN